MADPRKYTVPRRAMPGVQSMMNPTQRAIDRHNQVVMASWEFTPHLHFYLSDTNMTKSGDRGLRIDKLDKTDPNPVALDYLVQGVPFWGQGMDSNTNTSDGSADMVYAFDYTANAGAGQDIFRVSNESNAGGSSSSKTPKFFMSRSAGSGCRTQTSFFVISGGDNSNGLGGVEIQYWDAGGGYDALHLTQRSAANKRACVNFNGAWAIGNDEANINDNSLWITDKTSGNGACVKINTTGQFIIFHDLYHAGTKVGFYNTAPITKPTITGAANGNIALANLIVSLSNQGLIANSVTDGTGTGINDAVTSSAAGNYNVPQTGFYQGYNATLSSHSLNIQQILDASSVRNFIWMKGTLGSTSTVSTPTCTATQQGFGFECQDTQMSVVTSPTGTNQTVSRPLTFGSNAIGAFGATPVGQQANASQATINAVTDANAKAALQSIYNALKNLGWCAATA